MNTTLSITPDAISTFVSEHFSSLTCVIFETTPVIIQDTTVTPASLPSQFSREPTFQTIPITENQQGDSPILELTCMTDDGQERQTFTELTELKTILQEHIKNREQNLTECLTQPSLTSEELDIFNTTYSSRYAFYCALANDETAEHCSSTPLLQPKTDSFTKRLINKSHARAQETFWGEQPTQIIAICPECDHSASHIFRETELFKPQKYNAALLTHIIHCPNCTNTNFPTTHVTTTTPTFTNNEPMNPEQLYNKITANVNYD